MSTRTALEARFISARVWVHLALAAAFAAGFAWMLVDASWLAARDGALWRFRIYALLPPWALQVLAGGGVLLVLRLAWRLVRFVRDRQPALSISAHGLTFSAAIYDAPIPWATVSSWRLDRTGWLVVRHTPPAARAGRMVTTRLQTWLTDVRREHLLQALASLSRSDPPSAPALEK
ncbi:MAG: hypothetical protein O9284_01160 [Steroidobacteraceae bacterium]|nr:hypothetical protein [Steroidobacteraceae bacterium]